MQNTGARTKTRAKTLLHRGKNNVIAMQKNSENTPYDEHTTKMQYLLPSYFNEINTAVRSQQATPEMQYSAWATPGNRLAFPGERPRNDRDRDRLWRRHFVATSRFSRRVGAGRRAYSVFGARPPRDQGHRSLKAS